MIVLTAPTGQIGSKVLTNLLKTNEKIRVIARSPGKIPESERSRIEIVEGSHKDARTVEQAFKGADRVFWLVNGDTTSASAEESFVGFSRAGAEAMKNQGVKQVVGVSALGKGWPRDAGHVTATLHLDELIAKTDVAYRSLACGSLMENILRQIQLIKTQGVFFGTSPADQKLPFCATKDIAAIATKLLLDTSWKGVDSVPVQGPADISHNEIAKTMSDVLGKPIRYEEMKMEDFKAMLLKRGTSPGMTDAMINMMVAKNEGLDNQIPHVANSPTTFHQWCVETLKNA